MPAADLIGRTVLSRCTGRTGVAVSEGVCGAMPLVRVQFAGSWSFWAHPNDLTPVAPAPGALVLIDGGRANA
ncbi:MAG: hypothetical protein ACK53W_13425 [Gemmatimonadota bacterium]|jgi:hypothetical protein